MTGFGRHVDDYLRLRRSLGYKLHDHARLLRRFAVHLDAIGAECVTVELALAGRSSRRCRRGGGPGLCRASRRCD